MPSLISRREMQIESEEYYSKRKINEMVRREIEDFPTLMQCLATAENKCLDYFTPIVPYYDSKQERIERLEAALTEPEALSDLLMRFMVRVTQLRKPEMLTSVVGQCCGYVPLDNKLDQVKCCAELLGLMCLADCFDIKKLGMQGQYYVCRKYSPSKALNIRIKQSMYLPPMLCPPKRLTHNGMAGHLTEHQHVILKAHNQHDGDLVLESLNLFNQTCFSLNEQFLTTYDDIPKQSIKDDEEKLAQYTEFMQDSYKVCRELIAKGNKFWMTHRPDFRGRLYSQGYHVNTQGNSFRKAIVELAEPEIVEGWQDECA